MLSPKRVRYRKQMKGRMRGQATRGNFLAFGDFGLQAQECGWLTAQQIEAARIAITRHVKRGGQVWILMVTLLAARLISTPAIPAPLSSGSPLT